LRELGAAGCDKIFREQVSSVAERQQLEAALDYVREGDQFVCTKLDRISRGVADLLAIVARLEAKKVSLRVLSMSGSQALDTATSTGRLMLSVIGAVGQAEREAMLERQRDGIAKANYKWTTLEYKDPTVRVVGPTAIVRFTFVGEQEFNDGKKTPQNLHILMNWQKQGNDWKLLSRGATKL
jgi:DNA invertase Pin-like site-specific DNA recombinase